MAFQGILAPDQVAEDPRAQVRNWKREHDFAVCIDTDGCVLDNMWAKQVIVFHPYFMDMNSLRDVEMFYRLHAEHHNLWGTTRGCERYIAVQHVMNSLLDDPCAADVLDADHVRDILASIDGYVGYVQSDDERGFGLPSLMAYHEQNGLDFNFTRLMAWSEAVDRTFKFVTLGMKPFPGVRETLQYLSDKADVMVVSSTPYADLAAWWSRAALTDYIQGICGKEMGKKSEHIRELKDAAGYADDEVIMVGDGGGDLRGTRANNSLFYPVVAGREQEAWANAREAFDAFMAHDYRGEMEDALVDEFENALLEKGPWELDGYDAREEYRKLQPKRIETYRNLHPQGKLLTLDD